MEITTNKFRLTFFELIFKSLSSLFQNLCQNLANMFAVAGGSGAGCLSEGKAGPEALGLVGKGESQKVELKSKIDDGLGKSICSFANTNDGTIFVGVGDDGKIIGIDNKHEREIANIAHTCKPSIFPELEAIETEGRNIFLVKIKKSGSLHSFKNIAYKRIASHDKPLSPEEVIEFAKNTGKIRFDSQVCEGAVFDDIDLEKVEWFKSAYKIVTGEGILAGNRKLLEKLGCTKKGEITNAGILLFGRRPEKFFHQNQITIIRYPGNGVSDKYLDIKDFSGNLFDLIDRADGYIKEHIQIASRLVPGQIAKKDIPQYPMFAIRELIVNAVAHRDYSVSGSRIIIKMFRNRIEYSSPGGFPGDVTPENIADKQYSRNSILVTVLNKVKYIEAIGDGINRVIDSVKKHPMGPKLPLFGEAGNTVIITLHSADMNKLAEEPPKVELNKRQRRFIETFRQVNILTRADYEKINNISKRTAIRDLQDLLDKKIIVDTSTSKTDPNRKYTLA